jgi:CelD/BcsL family acetyltransferase involved in cellulose biosynthesis
MLGDRVVATLAALPRGDRLSSLLVAYDRDPEIARCSPGRLLVHEVVGFAIERGFATFDLGVGEARFKSECCEFVEPLFDTFVATSVAGRAAALGLAFQRRLKGYLKRSPRMRTLAECLGDIRR